MVGLVVEYILKQYDISHVTLRTYCIRKRNSLDEELPLRVGYNNNRAKFTDEEESMLVTYLQKAAYLYFGLYKRSDYFVPNKNHSK
jgi:hypothetical protein